MKQHEKDTQDCLSIEEDEKALNCLRKVVAQYSDSDVCRPRLVLLVQDGCIPCKEMTTLYADDIAKGIMQKVNIHSSEGKEIVKKNNMEFVPAVLLLDCHNNPISTV